MTIVLQLYFHEVVQEQSETPETRSGLAERPPSARSGRWPGRRRTSAVGAPSSVGSSFRSRCRCRRRQLVIGRISSWRIGVSRRSVSCRGSVVWRDFRFQPVRFGRRWRQRKSRRRKWFDKRPPDGFDGCRSRFGIRTARRRRRNRVWRRRRPRIDNWSVRCRGYAHWRTNERTRTSCERGWCRWTRCVSPRRRIVLHVDG